MLCDAFEGSPLSIVRQLVFFCKRGKSGQSCLMLLWRQKEGNSVLFICTATTSDSFSHLTQQKSNCQGKVPPFNPCKAFLGIVGYYYDQVLGTQ